MTFNSQMCRQDSPEDSITYSPPASPASNPSILSLQEVKIREREDLGRYSPRAVVAGRLGELAIRGDASTRQIQNNSSLHQSPTPQSAQSSRPAALSNDTHDLYGMPDLKLPSVTLGTHTSPLKAEVPCEPIADPPSQHQNIKSPPLKSTRKLLSSSPRKKRNAINTLRARTASASPPLTGTEVENPLTWNDSEITGHNPTDPNDDGYGINGIGFKPTAAMAWARSQKRQRQVADWKLREAREARERRREKRDGNDFDKIRTIQTGAIQKRVKFDV